MPVLPLAPNTPLARDAHGVPRYIILEELGGGGFGITYLARHLEADRVVAIKELACDQVVVRDTGTGRVSPLTSREGQAERIRSRFYQEARLLLRLSEEHSPHIVRVSDVFQDNGTVYYAMQHIRAKGHVPAAPPERVDAAAVEQALRYGEQVLRGLSVAHEVVALHGDIKPANLLIDERDRVVIIDFGTARTDDEMFRTASSAAFTRGYAPSELMSRERVKEAGPASDLYSWAMVFYGMLLRHPMEFADDDGKIVPWPYDPMTRLESGANDFYRDAGDRLRGIGVPAPIAAMVQRCLAVRISERPQRADEVWGAFGVAVAAPLKTAVPQATVPKTQLESPLQLEPAPPRSESATPTDPGSRAEVAAAPQRSRVGILFAAGIVAAAALSAAVMVSGDPPEAERPDAAPSTTVTPQAERPDAAPPANGTQPAPSTATPIPPAGFVYIPPGTFGMGSPLSEVGRNEDELQHSVTLTRGYFMQSTEVTQGQWSALMSNNPSRFSDCGETCPVEMVSWWDAVAYANALSRAEGLSECYMLTGCSGTPGVEGYLCVSALLLDVGCAGYRLPTESEWEYAARAGTPGPSYGLLDEVAWYSANSDSRLHEVGGLRANAWGVFDMLGNVWEWTGVWHGRYPPSGVDPTGFATGSGRVLRGGSWRDDADRARAAYRNFDRPSGRSARVGFRLVRSAP